ncbi:hypothetical protein DSECCO2_616610 [anaerobic digester metagenome]
MCPFRWCCRSDFFPTSGGRRRVSGFPLTVSRPTVDFTSKTAAIILASTIIWNFTCWVISIHGEAGRSNRSLITANATNSTVLSISAMPSTPKASGRPAVSSATATSGWHGTTARTPGQDPNLGSAPMLTLFQVSTINTILPPPRIC